MAPSPATSARRCAVRSIGAARLAAGVALVLAACANRPGAQVDCPVCDNVSELLVGQRCVPIAEVEPCGPDGHAHGGECHCLSGQQPTAIGGVEYCLQEGCGTPAIDTDAAACAEAGLAPESVDAVSDLGQFAQAHVERGHLAQVNLPAGAVSYVHFPADEEGEVLIYLDTAGVLDAVLDAAGTPLAAAIEGSNGDCPALLPEVWGAQVTVAGSAVEPKLLRFKAGAVPSVRLVLYESQHAHE